MPTIHPPVKPQGLLLRFDRTTLEVHIFELNKRTGHPKKKPYFTTAQIRQYFTRPLTGAKLFQVIVAVVCDVGRMVHGPYINEANFLTVTCTPRL